jgi:pimeloyl-ACP methyl ester carboxylesterase
MSKLIHMRGDLLGMFLFFVVFFVGLWQVIVAWKRLNGLSLTGRPDNRIASCAIGVVVMAGSLAWYFSGKGHFAYPDLEGIETLVVMVGGLVVGTAVELALAWLASSVRRALLQRGSTAAAASRGEELSLDVEGTPVLCTMYSPDEGAAGVPVLLLHDYAGSRADVGAVAALLSSLGHVTLSVDLDGHGANTRDIDDPSMGALFTAATDLLKEKSAVDDVAAVGIGLGGLLAMGLMSSGAARKAVAIDPPARDEAGHHDVNALRELGIGKVLAECTRPSARGQGGGRLSLSKLIASLPAASCEETGEGVMAIIGTREVWFNEPASLKDFAFLCSPFEPIFIKGDHESLPVQADTLEVVSGVLG